MSLPEPLAEFLGDRLAGTQGKRVRILDAVPVYSGSVNDTFRLETEAGRFFLKCNTADRFPSLFTAEADGLSILRATGILRVPQVVAQGEQGDTTFLLLEFIAEEEEDPDFQARFGRALARLHRCTNAAFGLDRDNFIGLLPQVNTLHADWAEFLVECRFAPLVKMARDHGRIHPGDAVRFERLYAKLPALFPPEIPALLHGDLWKHNYMAAKGGEPVLIDPAVYFGHREMDLAMTKLFGGFSPEFYAAYQAEEPLEAGWEARTGLCNLYPLLVHLNLFGGGYADRVSAVLRYYV
jgi:fructosamine-3-kinase